MSKFIPRIFPEIMNSMISRVVATTPVNDVNFGSVFSTMLEAAAQEDDEQYFQMLEIIRGYSLDTTTGDDLDARALEYSLTRLLAKKASTFVTLGDSNITKVSTGVYSGLPGAAKTTFKVNGDGALGFPISGDIIIGRGTPNSEKKSYSSITDNGNYVTFNLSSALGFDHGTDETIVLAQGGDRTFLSGTMVSVPASDISPKVDFSLDANAILLDGEQQVDLVPVTASASGTGGNVPVGSISTFDSLPFSTATVRNPQRVTNGADIEADQELRDRIKATIQSLSRGTGKAITSGVIGVISLTENKRVVSASLVEPTSPADVVKLYIDDGTGFIPAYADVGYEEVIHLATGGEKFVKATNVPIVKAFVATSIDGPWNLVGGETLVLDVGGQTETITFASTDFALPGAATVQEVLKKINSTATLFEGRATSGGARLRVFSRQNFDEQIRVSGGTANSVLGFPTDIKFTTKLYLTRNNVVKLLTKDGTTASIESGNTAAYNFSLLQTLSVLVDGVNNPPQLIWLAPTDFVLASSVPAIELAALIDTRLAGAIAVPSSGNTKLKLNSNILRSSKSKLQVVDSFDMVQSNFSTVFVNRTSTTGWTMFPANNDEIYLGHASVKFGSIYFNNTVASSDNLGLSMEYWNGASWVAIGFTDFTTGLTQLRGFMAFSVPYDWTVSSVNSSLPMYWIRLRRNAVLVTTKPVEQALKVSSANSILGFNTSVVIGGDKDYTLNRFIGQIELVNPLLPKDNLSLGSADTRASVVTGSQSPFGLSGGEVFTAIVDGITQAFTFSVGDFFTPGSALPGEIAARINSSIVGVTASVVNSTKVKVRVNRINGTLQINATTANNSLQFPTTLQTSLVSHQPAVESAVLGVLTIPVNRSIVVVMDGNLANNFTVPLFLARAVTSATSTSIVDAGLPAIFPNLDDVKSFDIEITFGPQSGTRRTITGYSPISGTLTFAAMGGAPNPGDTFQIIPTSVARVVKLWNNKLVTLISTKAEVAISNGGQSIQLASLKLGEGASILVSGGNGNSILMFPLNQVLGVDAYRNFTGLAQIAQWTVDGVVGNTSYDGIRAAGVQVEVAEPVDISISIEVAITTREGVALSSIANDIRSAISAYINTLTVGADVILSDIIIAAKSIDGVFDVKISLPAANIAIADNELARINDANIVVG